MSNKRTMPGAHTADAGVTRQVWDTQGRGMRDAMPGCMTKETDACHWSASQHHCRRCTGVRTAACFDLCTTMATRQAQCCQWQYVVSSRIESIDSALVIGSLLWHQLQTCHAQGNDSLTVRITAMASACCEQRRSCGSTHFHPRTIHPQVSHSALNRHAMRWDYSTACRSAVPHKTAETCSTSCHSPHLCCRHTPASRIM